MCDDKEIVSFEDGRYNDEIRATVIELLSLNVSIGKIDQVIRTVLKKLGGKEIGRLPSQALKSRLLVEANILAKAQVCEKMLSTGEAAVSNNCLHGDGTSKYHRHYQSFQITTASGRQLSIGLSETASGNAKELMEVFNVS